MKIVFLDAKSIGDDIDLSGFDQLGEVVKYGFSTPEEAGERTKDADVVIINKVQINEHLRTGKRMHFERNISLLVQIFHKIACIFHFRVTDCKNTLFLCSIQ